MNCATLIESLQLNKASPTQSHTSRKSNSIILWLKCNVEECGLLALPLPYKENIDSLETILFFVAYTYLDYATFLGLVAPLHATCPIIVDICLSCAMCLASISTHHVRYLATLHARCHLHNTPATHLLGLLLMPLCHILMSIGVMFLVSNIPYLVFHQCQVLYHVEHMCTT